MAEFCRALAARRHRGRLDRLILLFHRPRSRAGKTTASAAGRLWRGMAGPWRRLLPYPEISGRTGPDAGTSDLVQIRELFHLALRLPAALHRILWRRRPLPRRPIGDGTGKLAGNLSVAGF